jgi:hypothetical protein
MPPMEDTARLFNCAHCQSQSIICRHCDRGHIYCSAICAQIARQIAHRAADQRYQDTRKGQHKHAERQRRYRERQKEKVTDQGSILFPPNDLLPLLFKPPKERVTATKADQVICHFCGCQCALFLRTDFLQPSVSKKERCASLVWPLTPKPLHLSLTGKYL